MADGLRRLDGVADVMVDLQANVCAITPSVDRMPALEGFAASVRQTGYRPGRLWIQARGEVRDGSGGKVFRIAGVEVDMPLLGSVPAGVELQARVEFEPEARLVPEAPPARGAAK